MKLSHVNKTMNTESQLQSAETRLFDHPDLLGSARLLDVTRRHFFERCAVGLGSIALASLDARRVSAAPAPFTNPLQPKPQFGDVVDEIIMLLNRPDVRLKISVEIQAESDKGFDDGVQRAVRENCNQLKFKNSGFED